MKLSVKSRERIIKSIKESYYVKDGNLRGKLWNYGGKEPVTISIENCGLKDGTYVNGKFASDDKEALENNWFEIEKHNYNKKIEIDPKFALKVLTALDIDINAGNDYLNGIVIFPSGLMFATDRRRLIGSSGIEHEDIKEAVLLKTSNRNQLNILKAIFSSTKNKITFEIDRDVSPVAWRLKVDDIEYSSIHDVYIPNATVLFKENLEGGLSPTLELPSNFPEILSKAKEVLRGLQHGVAIGGLLFDGKGIHIFHRNRETNIDEAYTIFNTVCVRGNLDATCVNIKYLEDAYKAGSTIFSGGFVYKEKGPTMLYSSQRGVISLIAPISLSTKEDYKDAGYHNLSQELNIAEKHIKLLKVFAGKRYPIYIEKNRINILFESRSDIIYENYLMFVNIQNLNLDKNIEGFYSPRALPSLVPAEAENILTIENVEFERLIEVDRESFLLALNYVDRGPQGVYIKKDGTSLATNGRILFLDNREHSEDLPLFVPVHNDVHKRFYKEFFKEKVYLCTHKDWIYCLQNESGVVVGFGKLKDSDKNISKYINFGKDFEDANLILTLPNTSSIPNAEEFDSWIKALKKKVKDSDLSATEKQILKFTKDGVFSFDNKKLSDSITIEGEGPLGVNYTFLEPLFKQGITKFQGKKMGNTRTCLHAEDYKKRIYYVMLYSLD